MLDQHRFDLREAGGIMAPHWMTELPREMINEFVKDLSTHDVIRFVCAYMMSADLCVRALLSKIEQMRTKLTPVEKSTSYRKREMAALLWVFHFLIESGRVDVETIDIHIDGYCYLALVKKVSWMTVAKHAIGPFATPWDVDCFYHAQKGMVFLPNCGPCGEAFNIGGKIKVFCTVCMLRYTSYEDSKEESVCPERMVLKEIEYGKLYHLICEVNHHNLDSETERAIKEFHGEGVYHTLFHMTQKECYFTAKIGSQNVLNLDDESELSYHTIKPLSTNQKIVETAEKTESVIKAVFDYLDKEQSVVANSNYTVQPNDSASMITPNPSTVRLGESRRDADLLSQISSQMAKLTADVIHMREARSSRVGDYSRYEYESDLQDAFASSGMVSKDGQLFVRPFAHTGACELVPKITVDDRLNFLIRLHTAIFKMIDNSPDYPKPGFMRTIKQASEGRLPDDHPSFDLLQIVITDTIDWAHMMIKNNNFGLPVLEPGMRLNERILAVCLVSLKTEYFARWASVTKDCILPQDITDTSRWSDSHSSSHAKRITGKRPDLAKNHREFERTQFFKKRKDSLF